MKAAVGALDLAWLLVDARLMPMHIGVLQVFEAPVDPQTDWSEKWYEALRSQPVAVAPFNLRMHRRGLSWPQWEPVQDVDLGVHLQRWALPAAGNEAALHRLVGELHAEPLDLGRPLWEFHLIEGLADGGFALYIKMHHAIVDGMGGMRLLQSALSEDAAVQATAPWSRNSALARMPVIEPGTLDVRPRWCGPTGLQCHPV